MRDKIMAVVLAVALLAAVASRPEPPAARAGQGDQNAPSQVSDSGYSPDTNFQAFRSTLSSADTLTTNGVLATPALQVQGRTTLYLGLRFTNPAQTCAFAVAYVWRHPYAISDTDVTTRAFSWKVASFTTGPTGNGSFGWSTQSYNVASNVIKGISPVTTLTASATQFEGSYYPATTGDYFLDTERATTLRVLVVSPPGVGSVSFRVGS